ncbi:PIN domain-containing protein, partial [Stagnihabitans tardus]
MSFTANPFVVVLDANVLFPVRIRDVIFSFAKEGLFRARLTDMILAEWTRNLLRLRPELEVSIRRQEALIREHFEECFVEGYEPLIAGLDLPDVDDRHVLAAVIQIVSTGEALMERRLSEIPSEDWGDVRVDITPREACLDNL